MTLAVNAVSHFLDRVRADVAASPRKPDARAEDSFFAPCPDCDGDGEYENRAGMSRTDPHTGATGYEVVRCETCDGKGCIEVEAPELEMDERDEERI